MSDAKNWGLNKRRAEFEGGEGQVWKVQEGGGPTTRPRSKRRVCECRSSALRCVHQCQAHPMRQKERAATLGGGMGTRMSPTANGGNVRARANQATPLPSKSLWERERGSVFWGEGGPGRKWEAERRADSAPRLLLCCPQQETARREAPSAGLWAKMREKCPGAPPTKPGFEARRPEASGSERSLQRRAEFRL